MSTQITYAGGVITPAVVNGFETTRLARSIVHVILGRPDPDITIRPTGLRKGELTLIFATGAEAAAAEATLSIPQRFTLSDADVPEVSMSFVVAAGEIGVSLDLETQTVWQVVVPFQEIL